MNLDVRRLRPFSVLALTISISCAAAAFAGLLSSILKPKVELKIVYDVFRVCGKAGIVLLVFYGIVSLVVDFLYRSLPEVRVKTKLSSQQLLILKISAVLCFLLVILSPYLYVYPSDSGWVTVSKVSTTAVTEGVAREYLWRGIRMWCAILFWPGLGIAFLAGNLLKASRHAVSSTR